eukprot:8754855-Pyramimonas_sp.AAC.5
MSPGSVGVMPLSGASPGVSQEVGASSLASSTLGVRLVAASALPRKEEGLGTLRRGVGRAGRSPPSPPQRATDRREHMRPIAADSLGRGGTRESPRGAAGEPEGHRDRDSVATPICADGGEPIQHLSAVPLRRGHSDHLPEFASPLAAPYRRQDGGLGGAAPPVLSRKIQQPACKRLHPSLEPGGLEPEGYGACGDTLLKDLAPPVRGNSSVCSTAPAAQQQGAGG